MKINDVIKQVDLSKRAIKYYEEQGLLAVLKDTNGYRNYTDENITTLKTISVYRKLGISIDNIRKLLLNEDNTLLDTVLKEKRVELNLKAEELAALEKFINSQNIEQAYTEIDYKTIADAIQDAVPGFTGYFFINHFLPYLQIKICTEEQRQAYDAIIDFWDNTKIKMPIAMKLTSWIMYLLVPKPSIESMIKKMNQTMTLYT
ncbi:MAG: MerR family transcriptional regulator, partial [Lachnospiraceae bacterium]